MPNFITASEVVKAEMKRQGITSRQLYEKILKLYPEKASKIHYPHLSESLNQR
jgi:hypothetical protein